MISTVRRALGTVRALIALVALFSPRRRVIVAITEADLPQLDVGRGPFVAASAGMAAIASRWDQLDGLGPRQLQDLHKLLDPEGSQPWANVTRRGRSALYRATDEFRDALAAIDARSKALDGAEPVAGRRARESRAMRFLAPYTAVAEGWLTSSVWPWGMTLGGVETDLVIVAKDAAFAAEEDRPLWFWYGPAVPLTTFHAARGADGRKTWTRE